MNEEIGQVEDLLAIGQVKQKFVTGQEETAGAGVFRSSSTCRW